MFNARAVRDRVVARLSALRISDEEMLHEAYCREMILELDGFKAKMESLKGFLRVKASHPDKGWVMLDREQAQELTRLLNDAIRGP